MIWSVLLAGFLLCAHAACLPAFFEHNTLASLTGGLRSQSNVDVLELAWTAEAHHRERASQVVNYTYLEDMRGFGGNRKLYEDTYEIILIGGSPYRRRIMHDGKRLHPEDEQQQREQLRSEWERRKDYSYSVFLSPYPLVLPLDHMVEWFTIRMTGEEFLENRRNYVLEAIPQSTLSPARTEDEENAHNLALTIWIDEADVQISKVEARVVKNGFTVRPRRVWPDTSDPKAPKERLRKLDTFFREIYQPGTVITQEWWKVNDEVWLPKSFSVKGTLQSVAEPAITFDRSKPWPVDITSTYYDYKKFRVDTHVLPQ